MPSIQGSVVGASPRDAGPTPWWAVSTAMAAMFMAILDSYIVVVAGPAIQRDLGLSAGELQWTLASYQLALAVLLIIGGRLADRHGRRRVLVLGVTIFTASSVTCAAASGPEALIAARFVQGVGAAMMVPQVFAIIALLVPRHQRPAVFGRVGVVIGLATIGGQVVGGLLIGADVLGSGWRSVFWVNVPIGLATIALAQRTVPESRGPRRQRLDITGAGVLVAALVLLLYPLIQGRESGWPWWSWALLSASILAFAAFAVIEQRVAARGHEPLIAMALFRQRTFSLGIVLVLAVYALLTSYYLALSVALQRGLRLSALDAGLVYTPAAVVFLLFGVVAGKAVPRYGRRVLEIGSIVLALGYLATALVLLLGPPFTIAVVIPTLMLQSVGGGLLITPSLSTVLSRITPESVGMASGALSTAQQVGGALGIATVGALFFSTFDLSADDRVAAAGHAFAITSLGTFAIAVVAAVLVFKLPDD